MPGIIDIISEELLKCCQRGLKAVAKTQNSTKSQTIQVFLNNSPLKMMEWYFTVTWDKRTCLCRGESFLKSNFDHDDNCTNIKTTSY